MGPRILPKSGPTHPYIYYDETDFCPKVVVRETGVPRRWLLKMSNNVDFECSKTVRIVANRFRTYRGRLCRIEKRGCRSHVFVNDSSPRLVVPSPLRVCFNPPGEIRSDGAKHKCVRSDFRYDTRPNGAATVIETGRVALLKVSNKSNRIYRIGTLGLIRHSNSLSAAW